MTPEQEDQTDDFSEDAVFETIESWSLLSIVAVSKINKLNLILFFLIFFMLNFRLFKVFEFETAILWKRELREGVFEVRIQTN